MVSSFLFPSFHMETQICVFLATLLAVVMESAGLQTGSTRDILSTATPILPKTITSNPVIPIAASSTKSGKSLVEKGDDEEELSSYIRFIPASFTIGIFFIGFVVIYVFYYQKLKETNKKKVVAAEDKGPNDWLSDLRRTQKRKSIGSVLTRQGSSFQMKLRMKKYELYDDMLTKYKQSLKIQKLHSMRKTNTAVSNVSNSLEITNNEEDGALSTNPTLRKVNSKQRIKELAMRHKISQEHAFDIHLKLSGRGGGSGGEHRIDPMGGSLSISQDGDSGSGRFKSHSEMEVFREGFCEPLVMTSQSSSASLSPKTKVSWNVPPVSLDQVETSLSSFEDTTTKIFNDVEAVASLEDKEAANAAADEDNGGCGGGGDEISRSILEQPDIEDALQKISTDDAAPPKLKNRRPRSMGPISMNSCGAIGAAKPIDRATQKRLSWYQGLFKNSPVERSDEESSVDDLIQKQVSKAIYSRLVYNGASSGEEHSEKTKERQRPKSWMPVSENQRRKQKHEDMITRLFANLMELPEARLGAREETWDEDSGPTTSTLQLTKDVIKPVIHDIINIVSGNNVENYGDNGGMTEGEENMMIDEVEWRMIDNLEDSVLEDESEVMILEKLLNDVARFCRVYPENFHDDEQEDQINDTSEVSFFLEREEEDFELDLQSSQEPVAVKEEFLMYETRLTISQQDRPTTTSL